MFYECPFDVPMLKGESELLVLVKRVKEKCSIHPLSLVPAIL